MRLSQATACSCSLFGSSAHPSGQKTATLQVIYHYCGDWSDKRKSYRWVALEGGYRAADDCRAALDRLRAMATDASMVQ